MSKRIDKSWRVFASVENGEHDRCADFFLRPDGTYGFEEFRRDAEDAGEWTPMQYYSHTRRRSAPFRGWLRFSLGLPIFGRWPDGLQTPTRYGTIVAVKATAGSLVRRFAGSKKKA
jgi:hypothetical protein